MLELLVLRQSGRVRADVGGLDALLRRDRAARDIRGDATGLQRQRL
jgi:hypothetical protein